MLKGGFSDKTGHFARGDVAVADAELDHIPVADLDADCICFAVTDAPLRLTGPFGRLMHRLFGNHLTNPLWLVSGRAGGAKFR